MEMTKTTTRKIDTAIVARIDESGGEVGDVIGETLVTSALLLRTSTLAPVNA